MNRSVHRTSGPADRPLEHREAGVGARPTLVALGDLAVDVVVSVAAPVEPGTDVPGTIRFRVGGSAATTTRVFARLGGSARFVGTVGSDPWGRRLIAALRAEGVRADVRTVTGPSARLVVFLARDGERSFLTDRAAADGLRAEHVRASTFRGADVLHVTAYSLLDDALYAATAHAVTLARLAGAKVSVDLASAAPLRASSGRAVERLRSVAPDIVFTNAAEALALGAADGAGLVDVAPVVVIKQGALGARVIARAVAARPVAARSGATRRAGLDGPLTDVAVPTTPVSTADTTGAGDAFDAGFLLSWVRLSWVRERHELTAGAAPSDGRPDVEGRLRRAASAGNHAARDYLMAPRTDLA